MVRKTHQTIWLVFALFVAYLALVRVVITWAQLAPSQFSSTIEWVTDSDVSFETLNIEQGWLGVQVEVEDALIEHDGLEIEVGKVAFDFNLFSPLIPRATWGDYLIIEELAVLEYGLPSAASQSNVSVERFLTFNSQQLASNVDLSRFWKKVEINELTATIYQKQIAWKVNVASLQAFKGARWSLAADFNLQYGQVLQGERFQLKASLMPNIFGGIERGDFTVKAYDAIRLERLAKLTPKRWQDVLPDGELIPNVKGVISKSLLSKLTLELNAPIVSWQNPDPSLPKSVGLNLEWQNQAKIYDGSQTDWQFLLNRIQLDDQFIQTVSPVYVQLVSKKFLHIETEAFDLKPFKPLVKAILENQRVVQLFDASAELTLKNVIADIAIPELYFENLSAQLTKLNVPVTTLPGLAIQDLTINKTAKQITAHTPKPVWVMHPLVHPVPMRFDFMSDLTGTFDVPNNNWSLNELSLNWDDMPLTLSGSGDFQGKLDVFSTIEPGTVAKVKAYLPYSIMKPKLKNWLRSALVEGNQVKGAFFFKGDLNDYPFKTGSTEFGGSAQLSNATFKFNKQWPQIEKLKAQLEWSNFDLSIKADKAQLSNAIQAKAVNVKVGPLNSRDIAVEFSAQAQSDSRDAINYLLNGPLPKKLGVVDFLQDSQKVDLTGGVEVGLQRVWIPVSGFENKRVLVDGTVKFKQANLMLFDTLSFEKLAGLLKFNQDGVSSQTITGRFQDGQADFKVVTQNGVVDIAASGRASFDEPSVARGSANWTAQINIPLKPNEQNPMAVNLNADTSTVDWLMPAPLNNELLQGQLTTSLTFNSNGINVKGSAANLGVFDLLLINQEDSLAISEGSILLGKNKIASVNQNGVKITGSLPVLDLDGWGRWNMPELNKSNQKNNWLQAIDWTASEVDFDEVKFIDYGYKQVNLTWQNAFSENFTAKLLSKQISADLFVKPEGDIDVRLDWLQIFLPINSMQSDLSNTQREALIEECRTKPVTNFTWPNVNFIGKNIQVDKIGIPSLTFTVEDNDQRLNFKDIKAKLQGRAGQVTGDYYFYKQQKLSNGDFKLKSSDVKALTELIGLKKGFTGKRASVKSSVVWQGGLECFNLLGLLGKTEYEIKEGVIEDVEPGFARLLGLLNVTSLARRLSLDLKDVTTKGFAYDSISGETHFINGKLNLKDFELKAPSASVELEGDVDLIKRAFDLKAAVRPALGSSLPALSALTGVATPIGALAVYALMKVIPELNEELVTYRYSVTGPWDEPIIDGGMRPELTDEDDGIDDILQRD